MTGEKDYGVKPFGDGYDRLRDVLSRWSGLPPSAHKMDAIFIMIAETFPNENPRRSLEQLEKIGKAATEIEQTFSAMLRSDQFYLFMGMIGSERAYPERRDTYGTEKENRDRIRSFSQGLQDGAMYARRLIEERLKVHPDSKNELRRNSIVAIELSNVYFSITGEEPPKGGFDGPFQRLLRDVYEALGMQVDDLRGPLRKVHERRKNRHS